METRYPREIAPTVPPGEARRLSCRPGIREAQSAARADTEAEIGYGYVPNGMGGCALEDPRDHALRTALHHSIGEPDLYPE